MESDIHIRHLSAEDYDEALDFLNLVFSMTNRPHDFLKALPRMWSRDDEHMSKHIAVIHDGRIRSLLGVYPIPVVICGRKLLFSTVGNVATHPYDTGKGYMSLLLHEAMAQLDKIGADASRLSGLRQRYARYGYEPVGLNHSFILTAHNIRARLPGAVQSGISFVPISIQDIPLLEQATSLQKMNLMHADRGSIPDFYRTLTAWESRPFAAIRNGKMIGYLVTADVKGEQIAECISETDSATLELLCAWLLHNNLSQLRLTIEAWRSGLIRLLIPLCEDWSSASPCRFYLRHWDRITDALMALKNTQSILPDGQAIIGIREWGSLHLEVKNGETCARKTVLEPEFWLDPAAAAHLIAGSMPPHCVCSLPPERVSLFSAWFPLPLSWCTLDRV